ncbi:MAG: SGNH/GDSL hydrolase family protein [Candidatus Solibacter sp.]|nr:SGNH/GDSL hydrolase family protein [Candidatus Solibacter sp.]
MKPFLALLLLVAAAAAQTTPAPAPDATADPARLKTALDRATRTLQDWPNLNRYRADNAKVAPPAAGEERVVFMGDSITDGWGRRYGKFFPGKPYINRGISGQTTPQMLVRFPADVIALQPKAVVIFAGTNDIAGNTGPSTLEMIEDNLAAMTDLAQAHGIKVVLSAVMPTCDYIQNQSERRPNSKIIELNNWIKSCAAKHNAVYLDYFTPMLDDQGALKKEMTYDGLHPNDAGYEVMMPLAQKAVDAVLK